MPEHDPPFTIANLARALESVPIATAHAEARQRLAVNDVRDSTPPSYIASLDELRECAEHESRHAWKAARSEGFTIKSVVLRSDASGCCTVAGSGGSYSTQLDRIVFALVGPAGDVEVSDCFDIVIARICIDNLNARNIGPHISFLHAAELAVNFTEEHAQAIKNISIALLDARELDQLAVDIFGRAR